MKRDLFLRILILLAASSPTLAESRVSLADHVPSQVRLAERLGRTPADETVRLSLVVRLDSKLLDETLTGLYGPHSPAKKSFLSSAEFARRFDLPGKRRALKEFAEANGLSVDASEDQPSSLVVKVAGAAGLVEKAFGVQLNQYRLPDGRIFRGHETEPAIPVSLSPHLSAVLGLTNLARTRHPHIRLPSRRAATNAATPRPATLKGTGPGGGLAPNDIKTVYGLSGSLNGSGQTAAVYELDGYAPADIALYESQFGLPNAPLTFVGVDGAVNAQDGGGDDVEVALDIELMLALAPNIARLYVYVSSNTDQNGIDNYAKIAADDLASVVSTSWGIDEATEGAASMNAENTIFQQMAAQGQTIYAAAGDNAAYDGGGVATLAVDDPSSQPYVTGVGGTSLSGTLGGNVAETVWNDGCTDSSYNPVSCSASGASYEGGGGGVSGQWPLPSYQSGVAGEYSTTFRNVPDVSLNADPNSSPYSVCEGGDCTLLIGGTSAAAPLWASMTVLLNQHRAASGAAALGFANPTLYEMAAGDTNLPYAGIFNDVASGSNGFYNAGVGYDDASGWGSYKGDNMISAVFPAAAAPTGLTLTSVSSTSITLSWNANGNGPLTAYRVSYWDAAVAAATTTVDTGSGTRAVIGGLIPDDTYYLTVAALGSNGVLPSGLIVTTVTASAGPLSGVIGPAGGTLSYNTGEPDNTLVTLVVPAGAFPQAVDVSIGGAASAALPAPRSAAEPLTPTGVACAINLSPPTEPVENVALSMTYAAGAAGGFDPARLILARYDDAAAVWVPLATTTSGNTLTAVTSHLSTFEIMQTGVAGSMSSAKAFPNPMRATLGETSMTFVQLPADASVRIFTERGRLVRELTANGAGAALWDGNDGSGARAASGVYFVRAESGSGNRTFKVAVER
ncbi:MAG: protease pro-enzyme activation domain-containing protein [Elusimicrobiota bacterium]